MNLFPIAKIFFIIIDHSVQIIWDTVDEIMRFIFDGFHYGNSSVYRNLQAIKPRISEKIKRISLNCKRFWRVYFGFHLNLIDPCLITSYDALFKHEVRIETVKNVRSFVIKERWTNLRKKLKYHFPGKFKLQFPSTILVASLHLFQKVKEKAIEQTLQGKNRLVEIHLILFYQEVFQATKKLFEDNYVVPWLGSSFLIDHITSKICSETKSFQLFFFFLCLRFLHKVYKY